MQTSSNHTGKQLHLNNKSLATFLAEAEKELNRRSLSTFFQKVNEGYELNWHHKSICDTLQEFLFSETLNKLMIFVPPQHGKSTISSITFPAWALGKKPDLKIGVISYSADLANSFNRKTQLLIETENYNDIFPYTRLNSKRVVSDTKTNALKNSEVFEIVGQKGSYKTVGVGGSLTGNPLDLGIIDDPFKDRQEADSHRIRQTVWDWYTDVFLTRLHNKSKQLLLFTRWHEDDLAGRILAQKEAKEWTIISYPAIKEDNSNPNDPREIGQALWENRHSKENILAKKALSERTFASLYQQRPAPLEGGMIKRNWFKVIEWEDFYKIAGANGVSWNQYVDTAYTKNTQNDPTAILTCCILGNNLYIRDSRSDWIDSADLPAHIQKVGEQNGYNYQSLTKIEGKASGKTIISLMQRDTKMNVVEYIAPKLSGLSANTDKIQGVSSISSFLQAGRVHLIRGTWNDPFIHQCCTFPNGAHDDEVDCLVKAAIDCMFNEQDFSKYF